MKLSTDTVNVLKNFASINSGIEFKKGKTLTTISSNKTVLAKATLQDQIEDDFCIYDLNQFLSVYSINDGTELEFDDQNIIFKSGKSKIKYFNLMEGHETETPLIGISGRVKCT